MSYLHKIISAKVVNLIGEKKKRALRVKFDRKLKLAFRGTKVTSDAGLLAYRELDDALGLTAATGLDFSDDRKGNHTQHRIQCVRIQSVDPC